MMGHMPAIPESTRSSIILRLLDHAEKNWPQLAKVRARYHGSFAYITGVLRDGQQIPPVPAALRRLRPLLRLRDLLRRPATATKTPSCAPDSRSAPRKKPSTPPAPSTWPTSNPKTPDELTVSPT